MHPPARLRARAVLLGTLLIPLNLIFVIQVEVVYCAMQATNLSLFFNVVVTLALVTAGNALVRRRWPAQALTAGELRVVGIMCSVGTALCGVDMLQIFIGLVPYPYYFATPSNHWDTLLFPHLPRFLVVTDQESLKDLYLGYSTLYTARHLQAWSRPVIVWGVFLGGLLSYCFGVAALLRRPWADHERLTFPVIQLPLEMTRGGDLWRDPLCWAGFGVAAVLNLARALHTWVPAIPAIPQKWDIGPAFGSPPWNAVGWFPVSWYPFALGLGYLMPLELSFSCWFFFLAYKAQLVVRKAVGWGELQGMWIGAQGIGAWIGLGVMALAVTRKSLWQSLVQARRGADPGGEGMAPRTAWLAMIVGVGVVFAVGRRAGFTWGALLGFFGLYGVIVVCIARMRAELGPPSHDLARGGPDRILVGFVGAGGVGPRNLTLFTLLDWLTYSYRQHPVAHQLEGYQMASRSGVSQRALTGIMVWSCLVAYVAWMLLALDAIYRYGFSARIQSYLDDASGQAWNELAATLQGAAGPSFAFIKQFLGGMLLTVGLAVLRQRWVFFPLHPVGYAVNGNWTMSHLWFSLFLAWLLKVCLVKAGGLRAYRKGLPFCFGLMLGDCLVGGGLCLVSTHLPVQVRGFFP